MVYPVEKPVITCIPLAVDIWLFAHKYQTTVVENAMMDLIYSFPLSGNELELFAAAYKVEDEDLARRAVQSWVATEWKDMAPSKHPFLDCIKQFDFVYVPGMARIPAGTYYRLLRFVSNPEAQPAENFCIFTASPAAASSSPQGEVSAEIAHTPSSIHPSLSPPDVIIRSSDGVDISAHELLLQLAGAASLMVEQDPIADKHKLPVYQTCLLSRQLQQLVDL